MANFPFHIALGRGIEFYHRVDMGDPANARLIVVALKATGIATDATLATFTNLGALLAGTSDEATNAGYARKTFGPADLAAWTVYHGGKVTYFTLPEMVWASVAATGGSWAKLLVCYNADILTGTDADIIPMTAHDCAVTPNGTNITVTPAATGIYRSNG